MPLTFCSYTLGLLFANWRIGGVITSRDYLVGTLIEALNKKLKQKKAWEII